MQEFSNPESHETEGWNNPSTLNHVQVYWVEKKNVLDEHPGHFVLEEKGPCEDQATSCLKNVKMSYDWHKNRMWMLDEPGEIC